MSNSFQFNYKKRIKNSKISQLDIKALDENEITKFVSVKDVLNENISENEINLPIRSFRPSNVPIANSHASLNSPRCSFNYVAPNQYPIPQPIKVLKLPVLNFKDEKIIQTARNPIEYLNRIDYSKAPKNFRSRSEPLSSRRASKINKNKFSLTPLSVDLVVSPPSNNILNACTIQSANSARLSVSNPFASISQTPRTSVSSVRSSCSSTNSHSTTQSSPFGLNNGMYLPPLIGQNRDIHNQELLIQSIHKIKPRH